MADPTDGAGPYSIGSTVWPGLSKLVEECGEVMQVAGKILGTGGNPNHWDGTDLEVRLVEELGDLLAAIAYVRAHNILDRIAIDARFDAKLDLFQGWDMKARRRSRSGHRPWPPCIHGPGDPTKCGHPDCVGSQTGRQP